MKIIAGYEDGGAACRELTGSELACIIARIQEDRYKGVALVQDDDGNVLVPMRAYNEILRDLDAGTPPVI